MRIRSAIALQLDRVMKVASVANMGLLVLNTSLLVSQVWKWRGGPTWAWVIGSVVVISAVVLVLAHLWTQTFDMVRAQRKASAIHDAPQVYQLVPWERAVWINVIIPQMQAQAAICHAVGAQYSAEILTEQAAKLKKWETLGFIPREDYPPHLLKYYWHEEREL